jgi:hypothetical protein
MRNAQPHATLQPSGATRVEQERRDTQATRAIRSFREIEKQSMEKCHDMQREREPGQCQHDLDHTIRNEVDPSRDGRDDAREARDRAAQMERFHDKLDARQAAKTNPTSGTKQQLTGMQPSERTMGERTRRESTERAKQQDRRFNTFTPSIEPSRTTMATPVFKAIGQMIPTCDLRPESRIRWLETRISGRSRRDAGEARRPPHRSYSSQFKGTIHFIVRYARSRCQMFSGHDA